MHITTIYNWFQSIQNWKLFTKYDKDSNLVKDGLGLKSGTLILVKSNSIVRWRIVVLPDRIV